MMLLLPLLSMQMSHDLLGVVTKYVATCVDRDFTWMDDVLAACEHMAEHFVT